MKQVHEYKVKFKARVKGLFGLSREGVDVYTAPTASEAINKCREDFYSRIDGIDEEEVEFMITDVEKL